MRATDYAVAFAELQRQAEVDVEIRHAGSTHTDFTSCVRLSAFLESAFYARLPTVRRCAAWCASVGVSKLIFDAVLAAATFPCNVATAANDATNRRDGGALRLAISIGAHSMNVFDELSAVSAVAVYVSVVRLQPDWAV